MKQSNQPVFHLITASHNRAHLLPTCLEASLAQDYPNWIQYVVDDGSKDETPQLMERYRNEPRIQYHRLEQCHGVNFVRNFALDQIPAEPGHWIVIVDDDDYLHPGALSSQAARIAEIDDDIQWFVTPCTYPDGTLIGRFKKTGRLNYIPDYIVNRNISSDACHFIESSAVGDLRFARDIKQAEEWTFFLELAKRIDFFAVERPCLFKEYQEGGFTLGDTNTDIQEKLALRKLDQLEGHITPLQRRAIELKSISSRGLKGVLRHLMSGSCQLPDWYLLGKLFPRLLLRIIKERASSS